ncbi:MAG: phytanoyl-CoA dioxygenase family protein [Geminicoccaceae bacterium]
MSAAASLRVFYEPKIAAHPPELYRFDGLEDGIDAAASRSEDALRRYRDDGYLMVKGALPLAELEAARVELEQMARSDRPACSMIWFEGALRDHIALDAKADRELDGGTTKSGFVQGQEGGLPALDPALRARYVRKFMSFVDLAPALTALARHPQVLAFVRQAVGGEPELFQDMALVKPARGREKPWHQDHAYFNVAMGTPIVGVWIPMGRVTPENGCMHMLRGGHRTGARPHFKRRDWQICDTHVNETERVAVPMDAGDILFFDGLIPHGTPVNHTDEFRWAVQFHYRPAGATLTDDSARLAHFGSEGRDVTC